MRQPQPTLRAAADAGFTLIEMIVVMALMLVAGAMASSVMMDGMAFERDSQSSRKAEVTAADALNTISSDLRSARAPGREEMTSIDLRNAIMFNVYPAGANGNELMDIRVASPQKIAFLANVLELPATPGPPGTVPNRHECVVYDASNGGFLREVYSYSRNPPPPAPTLANPCGGALLDRKVYFEAPPAQPAGRASIRAAMPFRFTTMWNPSATVDYVEASECVRSAGGTFTSLGTTGLGRRIVSVDVDLRGYVMRGGSERTIGGEQTLMSLIELRARHSRDYLYALGCAY